MRKRNKERAKRIAETLEFYKRTQLGEQGPVDDECLNDLLTDIRHYCDLQRYDFAEHDRTAYGHYITELTGG